MTEGEREGMGKVEAAGGGAGVADDLEGQGEGEGDTKDKGKAKPKPKPTKQKTKPRAQRSAIELAVEDKLQRAEALVRRVWARHPNFEDIAGALLAGGLAELEERVGLSVGACPGPLSLSLVLSLLHRPRAPLTR